MVVRHLHLLTQVNYRLQVMGSYLRLAPTTLLPTIVVLGLHALLPQRQGGRPRLLIIISKPLMLSLPPQPQLFY